MLPACAEDDALSEIDLTTRFKKHLSRKPADTIHDEDMYDILCQLRSYSSTLAYTSRTATWLIKLLMSDDFTQFYMRYLELLCRTDEVDYISHSVNRCVTNFIKLHIIIWNVTDKADGLCVKLVSAGVISHLFRLLSLVQLHEAVGNRDQNALWLAHGAVGILQNVVNHIPNAVWQLKEANAFNILSGFLTEFNTSEGQQDLDALALGYHGPEQTTAALRLRLHDHALKTAIHFLLSFLPNEDHNESDDLHIVYLLTALDDALNGSTTLYSSKFGYSVEELLVGFTNLAKLDRNKKALIRNNAMESIQKSLTVAHELKYPYVPDGAEFVPTLIKEAHGLAEKTLNFLWFLSLVPESMDSLKPGSVIRGLVERFSDDFNWPDSCVKAARSILCTVSYSNALPSSGGEQEIAEMMALERRQCSRRGHVMISYSHRNQDVMLRVRDKLQDLGYDVWMDADQIQGLFGAGMAKGIQQASGLILGISQAFIDSQHCRQGMLFAYLLQIPFYPLELQENVVVDGWLAMLLTTIKCIPLCDETMFDNAVRTLVEQLGDRGRRLPGDERPAFTWLTHRLSSFLASPAAVSEHMGHAHPSSSLSMESEGTVPQSKTGELDDSALALLPSATLKVADNRAPTMLPRHSSYTPLRLASSLGPGPDDTSSGLPNLLCWTKSDVARWLAESGLAAYIPSFSGMDGSMVVELDRFRRNANQTLSDRLLADLGMPLSDQQRLFIALTKLSTSDMRTCPVFY
ncbi:hypothetical protein T265_05176 [Opisthorchis viverrini]|uniref:TIR domain-containing protein n=1 Tax=Opisthorchis viverrini TaxID=6198 RepID=A0A074ZPZ7_OPIVI|nr:hypothetical protein T265_05176 [Opisthorchis viverrini]KER27897.1 hypothetical protein T265_05176 [Opisthorchis viverrini]